MKYTSLLLLVAVSTIGPAVSDAFARGGGGGGGGGRGGGGGGGVARPAANPPARPAANAPARPAANAPARPVAAARPARPTPSMSRPAGKPVASKPVASKPVASKPVASKPASPPRPSKPDIAGGASSARPDVTRPNIPNSKPAVGNRPNLADNKRPSQGQLNDFLDLPGQSGASTLPGAAKLPGLGTRPNIDAKSPKIGNQIGDKAIVAGNSKGGDQTKIKVGDININSNNKVSSVNREKNINSIHNKYNNNSHYHRPFGPGYWGGPGFGGPGWRWHAGWNRYPGYWGWRPCSWAAFGTWFVWQWAKPFNYDYGTSVVYTDNYVYIDGQQAATSEQYYQQAETIAQSTPPNIDETKVEWMPLGVFAITEEDATDTGMMVQLAVSKEGIIAGTFFNEITDTGRPVEGMVDRQTQRAVWKYADGKNTDVVMETGISNLTKDDATALVHFGPEKTQTWLMVRLPAPEDEAQK